ncbi:hypothetical protein MTP99_006548 [Tenebrio molitor]|jgi:hypothetical protein|nr:hypothetical protein MTP99_006548 [Tenebrio molitor]
MCRSEHPEREELQMVNPKGTTTGLGGFRVVPSGGFGFSPGGVEGGGRHFVEIFENVDRMGQVWTGSWIRKFRDGGGGQ